LRIATNHRVKMKKYDTRLITPFDLPSAHDNISKTHRAALGTLFQQTHIPL